LSTAKGSWLDKIEFDGKVYWQMKKVGKPEMPRVKAKLLPSDCRFREDVLAVAAGDWDLADQYALAFNSF
jgi:hypothetical protein